MAYSVSSIYTSQFKHWVLDIHTAHSLAYLFIQVDDDHLLGRQDDPRG